MVPTEQASSDKQMFLIHEKISIGTLVKGIKSDKNCQALELYIISNDKIKKDLCRQQGIDLLIVDEHNWINYKEMECKKISNWIGL